MTDLGTLGGTLAGSELLSFQGGLNNLGQVSGGSFLAGDSIFHPFLWTSPGPMQDLGTLGGQCGTAFGINDAGVVIGEADLPGNCNNRHHAFMWTQNAGMTDLGTVDGDGCSFAEEINSTGQIVGVSLACDSEIGLHAFLWQGGQIIDLNKVIPPNSALFLTEAFAINDLGEIAGVGVPSGCSFDALCGHAFVLIPCDQNHPNIEGCDYSLVDASATATAAPASSAPAAQMPTAANSEPFDLVSPTIRSLHRRMMPLSRGPRAQPLK